MPTDEEMKVWRDDPSTNGKPCPWCGGENRHGEHCPVRGFMHRLHHEYADYCQGVIDTDVIPPCPACGAEAHPVNDGETLGTDHAEGCDFAHWFNVMKTGAFVAAFAEFLSEIPGLDVRVALARGEDIIGFFEPEPEDES